MREDNGVNLSEDEDIHPANQLCFVISPMAPPEDLLPLCKVDFQVLCKIERRSCKSQERRQSFRSGVSCPPTLAQADACASYTSNCIVAEGFGSGNELAPSKMMSIPKKLWSL